MTFYLLLFAYFLPCLSTALFTYWFVYLMPYYILSCFPIDLFTYWLFFCRIVHNSRHIITDLLSFLIAYLMPCLYTTLFTY